MADQCLCSLDCFTVWFFTISEPQRQAKWELEAARSVRHATKEDRGAGRSSLVSQHKAWVTALKGTGTHRSQLESLSVRPAAFSEAWIKERSVAAVRLVCLMGVAPLFSRAYSKEIKTQLTLRQCNGFIRVKVKQGCPVIPLHFQTPPRSICSRSDPAFHHKHASRWHVEGRLSNHPLRIKGSDFIMVPYQTATRRGYLYDKATFLFHAFSWVDLERWMKEEGSGWWPRGQGVEGSSWSHYLLIDWFRIQPIVFGACPLFCRGIKMHRFLSAISLLVDLIS